ncbi:hypothetical protein M885DRAFT_529252 [Pelagophyceae sp. CCMP2097]|nr:hypothetical protein M885DRAFT_529252 [Pelagophyceae sp. CCMP2097]
MFETPLGAALYKPGYPGGAAGRRKGLAAAVQPVLVDMLLLASADEFWPTPGSTMSQSVCMWRKAWRKHSAVPNIQSCEEIVLVPR